MTDKEYQDKKRECWEDFCRHIVDEEEEFYNMFDRAYSLGKQENDMEDTVIQGWVCRDKRHNALNLHVEKPYRTYSHYSTDDKPDWWESDCASFLPLDNNLFPDLTWESDPIEVEIIIKRKKK